MSEPRVTYGAGPKNGMPYLPPGLWPQLTQTYDDWEVTGGTTAQRMKRWKSYKVVIAIGRVVQHGH